MERCQFTIIESSHHKLRNKLLGVLEMFTGEYMHASINEMFQSINLWNRSHQVFHDRVSNQGTNNIPRSRHSMRVQQRKWKNFIHSDEVAVC